MVRPGGRLVLLHPSGRAALAAATAGAPATTTCWPPAPLATSSSTGWRLARDDDGPKRFLVVAERTSPAVSGRRPGRSRACRWR